ncbi:MAG: hypothetical protein J6A16_08600 [Oscillospiraceae bacterium]|nr:hypothetical protein [Oscillospiraceae bacterium]
MARVAVSKKKSMSPVTGSDSLVRQQRLLSAQISTTSGASSLDSRDPVFHLTNTFVDEFNAVGKERAKQMAGNDSEERAEESETDGLSHEKKMARLRQEHDSPMYRHSSDALKNGDFVDRFSSYAFNGGNMAAAVMSGKGKMMFTACLSKALGRTLPTQRMEKQLLSGNAVNEKADGTHSDVMFNRNAHSAVGITLDAVRGASTSLEVFRKLANESFMLKDTPFEHRNIETMSVLFPFLVTEKDEALIDSYKQRLKALEGDNSQEASKSRKTLEWALKKESAVLERKKTEQRRFLTVLDGMLSNVKDAEKMFSADGFAESVIEEIEELLSDDPPEDQDRNESDDLVGGADLIADFLTEVMGSEHGKDQFGAKEQPQASTKTTSSGEESAEPTAADTNASGGARRKRK